MVKSHGKVPPVHDTQTLRTWVGIVSSEVGIELRNTHSNLQRVWKRASRVLTEFRRLCHGQQQQEYLEKQWRIELEAADVKGPKDLALEEKILATKDKNAKLQKENSELKKTEEKMKKTEEKLKKKVNRLSGQIRKAIADGYQPTRGHSRVKSPSKCTSRHRRNLKRKRTDNCTESLSWLEAEGYTATSVTIRSNQTGDTETVVLDASDLLGPNENSIPQEELDTLNMMLYVKDKYNVSGDAYHEMTQLCKSMPCHYKLKDRIAELNKRWNIRPTPEGTCDNACSALGNHCLAIFKEPESYDSVK